MRRKSLALGLLALLTCCRGAGEVRFEDSQCFIDGAAATLAQVEKRQAEVAHHVSERQPLIILVTVVVVVLASSSYIERLLLLLSVRRAGAASLAERFRQAMARYRKNRCAIFQ